MTDPDCFCDKQFRDALDVLAFRHYWCVTCEQEVCGGSPVNHKALGHEVRRLRDE